MAAPRADEVYAYAEREGRWELLGRTPELETALLAAGDGIVVAFEKKRMGIGGTVHVYRRDGGRLAPEAQIPTELAADVLVVHRGQVFVGDAGQDWNAGAVEVYEQQGNAWVREQRLQASNRSSASLFGMALDVHGDLMVVGAPRARNEANERPGAAYLFRWEGKRWREVDVLRAPAGSERDGAFNLGSGVAITDGWVYASTAPFGGINSVSVEGRVLAFKSAGDRWRHVSTMALPESRSYRTLGQGLSASGSCVAAEYDGRTHDEAVVLYCEQAGWSPLRIDGGDRQSGFGASFDWGPKGLLVGAYLYKPRQSRNRPGRAVVLTFGPR